MSEFPQVNAWQRRARPDVSASTLAGRHWRIEAPAELTAARIALHDDLRAGMARPAGTGDGDVERLLLAFEELASNGLRHGGPPVTVEVVSTRDCWLIDVVDSRPDLPPVPPVDRDPSDGGLGLHLVARLSDSCGWAAAGSVKHVWACLAPDRFGR